MVTNKQRYATLRYLFKIADCVDNRCTGGMERCAEDSKFLADVNRCRLELEYYRRRCSLQYSDNRHWQWASGRTVWNAL